MKLLALTIAKRHREAWEDVGVYVLANATCPSHRIVAPCDIPKMHYYIKQRGPFWFGAIRKVYECVFRH